MITLINKKMQSLRALTTCQINSDTLTQKPFAKALSFESGNNTNTGKGVQHA